jgi:hypothetical protein
VRYQQVDSCRLDDPAESGRSARENISLITHSAANVQFVVPAGGQVKVPTLRYFSHGLLILVPPFDRAWFIR